ncbi:hypothetical protein L6164_028781 [Bauhinia variegata]|uniref:Uncharacterized protein n=1 Tax=Bauhinia variegata TaxID=167791 RepID=A0ACB9L8K0_BAUVA|nr:hypothetical protein L6164_028781 [Bauhinia variegata]
MLITALSPGESCFDIAWPSNTSYAFNSYYQQHDQQLGSCDFGGLALITSLDPSMNQCRFLIQIRTSGSESYRASNFLWIFLLVATFLAFLCNLT